MAGVVDGLGGGRKDDVVGWSGNLKGTYWIVVIRPQLSRTATASVRDTCDRPISIFDRTRHGNTLACLLHIGNATINKCKHAKTR